MTGLRSRAGGVMAAQAATLLGALVTDSILARSLPRDSVGCVQAAFMVLRVSALVGALGVPTALFQLWPRWPVADRRILSRVAMAVVAAGATALGALVVVSGGVLSKALAVDGVAGDAALLVAAGLALPLFLAPAVPEATLILRGRAWSAASAAAAAAALQVLGTMWVLRAGISPSAASSAGIRIMAVVALAAGARAAFALWLSRSAGNEDDAHVAQTAADGTQAFGLDIGPGEAFARLRVVAAPVAVMAAVDAFSAYTDRTLVLALYGPAALATYRFGAQEVPFIGLLVGAMTPVLLPEFSRMLAAGDRVGALDLWRRAARRVAPVLAAASMAIVWAAPAFLATLYSDTYRDSALYFRVYLLILPLRVVAFMPMMVALGSGRAAAAIAAGEVAANIAISWFLMGPGGLGMAGAALGTVAATALQAAAYIAIIRRGLGCGWGDVLPWTGLVRAWSVAGLWFAPVGLAAWLGASDHAVLAVVAGLGIPYLVWTIRSSSSIPTAGLETSSSDATVGSDDSPDAGGGGTARNGNSATTT